MVRIELRDRVEDLHRLNRMGIDVDAVLDGWVRAYVVEEELAKLRLEGFAVTRLPPLEIPPPVELPPGFQVETIPPVYHTYETLVTDMQGIAADHPDITRLFTIGQTVQGRDLLMMLISADPDMQSAEPEFLYIGAMHGDEVVGKEMLYHLIDYLTDGYGVDPRATDLVDGAEIWIMPSMNPDGTALVQRYNANFFDLNRSFPDWFFDPDNSGAGRQPEVLAVMQWSAGHSIDLAANMHGGTIVANYPWDNNSAGASVFSPTDPPDHDAFLSISRTYADNNPAMYANDGGSFDHGVTNGAAWYAVTGGMQDWAYAWNGTFEVTMELSYTKWPAASTLPSYWDDNLESMLSYMERGFEGVHGVVTDADTGLPVAATIRVDANPFPSSTDPDVGDYHRLVLPGIYTLEFSALGYAAQAIPVDFGAAKSVVLDVALQPLATDLQPVATRVEDGPGGDGWLDGGELADLAVTASNAGRSATGVGARLIPTGWFATVPRETATFPDLPVGSQAESDAPYFQVLPAADVPAGHRIGFALEWTADQGAGTSEPFFLEVGAPACEDVAAADVPKAINDNTMISSRIDLAGLGPITGIQVSVDITHTYIGDLLIRLVSPSGTGLVLHNQQGGSADDIVGTYGVDLTPYQPLSTLHGEIPAGSWYLEVTDKANGDTGSLNAWSLDVCSRPQEATTPEMRFREITAVSGGVRLRWWPYPGLESYRVYRGTVASSPASFVDVTAEDPDDTDTEFEDSSSDPLLYFLVTGVGPNGEGP
jgi:carboxypeptidase D